MMNLIEHYESGNSLKILGMSSGRLRECLIGMDQSYGIRVFNVVVPRLIVQMNF